MKNKLGIFIVVLAMMALMTTLVSAADSCINGYSWTNGTANFNVTVGNVCINSTSTDVDPTATSNCDVTYTCVAGATSAPRFYRGYTLGSAVCTETGKVSGGTYTLPAGKSISTSATAAASCSMYGYTYVYGQSDLQNIVVDGLGTAGASFVSWIDLLIVLIVLGFIVGIAVKMGTVFK